MAHCPKCRGEFGQLDTICPHCGYDFPKDESPRKGKGFVYSSASTMILILGSIVAGFIALIFMGWGIWNVYHLEWFSAFEKTIAALLMAALYVALTRVADLD